MTEHKQSKLPFEPISENHTAETVAKEMISLFIASVYGENKQIVFDAVDVVYLDDKTAWDEFRCQVDVQATFDGWGSSCTLRACVPMCGKIAWGCEHVSVAVEVVRGLSPERYLLLSDAGINDNYATIAVDVNPNLDMPRCYIADGFEQEVVCRLMADEVPDQYTEDVAFLMYIAEEKAAA